MSNDYFRERIPSDYFRAVKVLNENGSGLDVMVTGAIRFYDTVAIDLGRDVFGLKSIRKFIFSLANILMSLFLLGLVEALFRRVAL